MKSVIGLVATILFLTTCELSGYDCSSIFGSQTPRGHAEADDKASSREKVVPCEFNRYPYWDRFDLHDIEPTFDQEIA